jgi:hypothetical protein
MDKVDIRPHQPKGWAGVVSGHHGSGNVEERVRSLSVGARGDGSRALWRLGD